MFNVSHCHLHWQSQGIYLGAKVDRCAKSKKLLHSSFEFFQMKVKEIPVISLEMKDLCEAFAWEPSGHRFALSHGEVTGKFNVSFYEITAKHDLELIVKLERKPTNALFWSPKGSIICLAGLKQFKWCNGIICT